MSFHAGTQSRKHLSWDNSIPPVLIIKFEETIVFDYPDAHNGQDKPASEQPTAAAASAASLRDEAGHVLQVDIIECVMAGCVWATILLGSGFLVKEFGVGGLIPALKVWLWNLENGWARFDEKRGIRVSLCPFCGVMGVDRDEPGKHSTKAPYPTGGDIGTRHAVVGPTLCLPVGVEGVLFSCGDRHAARGDGEIEGRPTLIKPGYMRTALTAGFVVGTAIEMPVFRFPVLKDKKHVKTPYIETPSAPARATGEGDYITTDVESNILDATKAAVRYMIDIVIKAKSLTAFAICGGTQSWTCPVMLWV